MNHSCKNGDTVIVLSGKDKGEKGKVLAAMPEREQGHCGEASTWSPSHAKPRRQGETGGIVKARPPSVLQGHACSAPSAARLPASASRSRATRRPAFAASAAPKSEKGAIETWLQNERKYVS